MEQTDKIVNQLTLQVCKSLKLDPSHLKQVTADTERQTITITFPYETPIVEEVVGVEEESSSAIDMDSIINAIDQAKVHGLTAEVLAWAFYHMRNNPNDSIATALEAGLTEWDI